MSVVVVPIEAPPNWSPAMDAVLPGETAACGLDGRQWAASRALTVLSVDVAIDPSLSLPAPPAMVDGVCVFDLAVPAGATPFEELPVLFTLHFAEDASLIRIIPARLPVRGVLAAGLAAPASAVLPGALMDDTGYLTDADGVLFTT